MTELELKYGLNPNQKPARLFMPEGVGKLPLQVLNGRPGYINFMDALNGWQLVRELKAATSLAAAASFKHVSPAGVAVAVPMSEDVKRVCFSADLELSPIALAYARARGSDRLCSYGDWAALSDICDEQTALLLAREVSDGVIAPGYTEGAMRILREKRRGVYNVVQIDPGYEPESIERREIFGVTFEQGRNTGIPCAEDLANIVTANKDLSGSAKRDLTVALITVKYTQSNSVCYVENGQAVGVGAGQQSRVHCVRLAGSKADNWYLRRHPKVLGLPFLPDMSRPVRDNAIDAYIGGESYDWRELYTVEPEALTDDEKREWLSGMSGLALASDAFFPFNDNIERAAKSGVKYIAQPGGSIRDDLVIEACDKYGMVMAFTGKRLFHH